MRSRVLACWVALLSACAQAFATDDSAHLRERVTAELAKIREAAGLPALAGAIVTSQGVRFTRVVGVRKLGADVPATIDDPWHLGSDTKALTATLIGLLVDDGVLRFDDTMAAVFPELSRELPAEFRNVTVAQLLAHQSGLPRNTDYDDLATRGTVSEQRLEAVRRTREVLSWGTGYSYSNWGYVVLGAIAERVGRKPWEDLVKERIFAPLGIEHAGFGGIGTEGKLDAPWPHQNGRALPNGPKTNFPALVGPAGLVHCPISEWAKFVADQLRGLRGEPCLLKPATFERLHRPEFGGTYAGGWLIVQRPWAHGTALTHAGSDGRNFAVAWLAPARDAAFLVCTNAGDATKPCDDAIGVLIRAYLHPEG